MWLEREQFIDESILKEIKEKEEFIKASAEPIQQPMHPDYLKPDKIKLENCSYETLKSKAHKCVVSWRGLLGNGKSSYGFEGYPYIANDEKFHMFEGSLPSYLHLKQIKGNSGQANNYIVYLYDDNNPDPICQPIEVFYDV